MLSLPNIGLSPGYGFHLSPLPKRRLVYWRPYFPRSLWLCGYTDPSGKQFWLYSKGSFLHRGLFFQAYDGGGRTWHRGSAHSCIRAAKKVRSGLQIFPIENFNETKTSCLTRKPDYQLSEVGLDFWSFVQVYYQQMKYRGQEIILE